MGGIISDNTDRTTRAACASLVDIRNVRREQEQNEVWEVQVWGFMAMLCVKLSSKTDRTSLPSLRKPLRIDDFP
jgi:hypothetical protein